jgi:hypothetical protein
VSQHRFSPPSLEDRSSGGHILFMLLMVLSRSFSLYSGEHFSPLGTLFLSVFVISVLAVFALRICNHTASSCLSWGSVQGVPGIIFLYIRDFYISIFSHPSYSCFPCSILSHSVFLLGAYIVCVHHDSVFCVCTLCFSTPCVWRALYLEGHIYFAGHIYLEAYICLEGSSLV